ncbi:MAG: hypothetical protein J6J20_05795 [Muribaculaceae bacterium]|nr:hypothetical protein [Muribaculaceae bacterium]
MNRFLSLLLLLTLALASVQCSDDVDCDYPPVILSICVQNAEGENLLDENMEANVLDEEIYVDYSGRKYYMSSEAVIASLSVYPNDENKLIIGPFYGSGHKDCTLHIGARAVEISFDVNGNGYKYYFDGKRDKQKGPEPEFVLTL